jgi:hypothetical protein
MSFTAALRPRPPAVQLLGRPRALLPTSPGFRMLEHHHHLLGVSSLPSRVASVARWHASRSLQQEALASRSRTLHCFSSVSLSKFSAGRYDRSGRDLNLAAHGKADKEVQSIVLLALGGQANSTRGVSFQSLVFLLYATHTFLCLY